METHINVTGPDVVMYVEKYWAHFMTLRAAQ